MAHVYMVQKWQSPTGKWHCNDIKDLAGVSGKWWVPARMLGMSLTDYVLLLKEEFKADIESYYEPDCHRYVVWINAMARKANFIV